ncbi:hypothetical protein FQR65_LT18260 [Abscondita terminalis]|nr:hypothetical protein FQR65_LT18260 [Abscondita terminalis]
MIAKLSKILLKLEKGELLECKNKKLDEIVINTEEYISNSSSGEEEEVTNKFQQFTVPLPTNENEQGHEMSDDAEKSSSSSREEDQSTEQEKVKQRKQPWTTEEFNCVKKHFWIFLQPNAPYPSSKNIRNFLDKYSFHSRTIAQLRSKIQHLKKHV